MLKHLKEEVVSAIPAIIFFVISLNLINFTESLMFRPEHIQDYSFLTVTLFALVLGKFLILVNNFSFINAFPDKPLIYNIIWKMSIYTPLVFLFRIVERFVDMGFKDKSLYLSFLSIGDMLMSPVFWSVQLWVLMLFFIYVVSDEFVRVLGGEKIKDMIWGKKTF